jgi:UDP-GlcNAc:undecaprenyl-phosphate/decaprenyl-phosphate GlcNAc-1-phosphate transferase
MRWQATAAVAAAAGSFFTCWIAIVALRPLAIAVDLVDRPGGRKTHHGDVPVVGGLAMFLGVVLGVGLLPFPSASAGAFLAACAILVTVGLVDDRFDLSPWTRLPGQIAAALVLSVGSGTLVVTLGDPFGTGTINFSQFGAVAFTIFIIISAINAFNMLDGMDGLAGTSALASLLAVAYVSYAAHLPMPLTMSLVIIGAVCAFLFFNVPLRGTARAECFMGDAGSTLLGFCVAWLCIQVSQGATRPVSAVTTLWFVALPLYELVWSTIRRVIRGVSPFKADADHFHHLLLKAGFGTRGAYTVFATLTFLLAGVGLLCSHYKVPDHISLLLLAVLGCITIRLMYGARLFWALVPRSISRGRVADTSLDEASS